MSKYSSPKFTEDAFNCVYCRAYSHQRWHHGLAYSGRLVGDLSICFCQHCGKYSVWHKEKMIYPISGQAPLPNPDLPDDVKSDYEEASNIVSLSPRGAAALLRLAIQKLCKHLGEKGKNINEDIANLVAKGLNLQVQMALDSVRVIGNEAVHPGTLDLNDDNETTEALFWLVNFIAEEMITKPKKIDFIFNKLPENKRNEIKRRNAKALQESE